MIFILIAVGLTLDQLLPNLVQPSLRGHSPIFIRACTYRPGGGTCARTGGQALHQLIVLPLRNCHGGRQKNKIIFIKGLPNKKTCKKCYRDKFILGGFEIILSLSKDV